MARNGNLRKRFFGPNRPCYLCITERNMNRIRNRKKAQSLSVPGQGSLTRWSSFPTDKIPLGYWQTSKTPPTRPRTWVGSVERFSRAPNGLGLIKWADSLPRPRRVSEGTRENHPREEHPRSGFGWTQKESNRASISSAVKDPDEF